MAVQARGTESQRRLLLQAKEATLDARTLRLHRARHFAACAGPPRTLGTISRAAGRPEAPSGATEVGERRLRAKGAGWSEGSD